MKTKYVAYLSLLLALSLIFSYVEYLIPIPISVPGIKLGLANCIVLYCIYRIKPSLAFLIGLMRVIIVLFLFGNIYSFLFSLAGFVLSFFAMLLSKRSNIFSIFGVSICGAVFHNVGQVISALLITKVNGIINYLPVLTIAAFFTGALNAVLVSIVLKRIKIHDCLC